MTNRKNSVLYIVVVAFGVIVIASFLFVAFWQRTPTLETTIEEMGYVPMVPPNNLAKPGSLLLVGKHDPLELDLICSAEGSLGYANEWEYLQSQTVTFRSIQEINGQFSLDLDAREIFSGINNSSVVQSIDINLTNARILALSDEDVFARIGNRNEACRKALSFRIQRKEKITMVRSVLVADAKLVVKFERDTKAAVQSEAIKYIASEINGEATSGDTKAVFGTQLSWGLRDDMGLAAIQLGSPTGTAATLQSLLKPAERIRAIKLPKLVDLEVLPLKQPTPNTCWAAAAGMIVNWRDNTLISPEQYANSLGTPWDSLFSADRGISSDAHRQFASNAGFVALPPQNLSIQSYVQLLKNHGPLWIATVGPPSFSAHARVLVGVYGDGKPHSTEIEFIDPIDGLRHREPFMNFIESFEREARVIVGSRDDMELRWQILHLP